MQLTFNSGKFIANKDIKHKMEFLITEDVIVIEQENYEKTGKVNNHYVQVKGEIDGLLKLNMTSLKLIANSLGSDTSKWIGYKVKAWQSKTQKGDTYYEFNTLNFVRDDRGEYVPSGQELKKEEKSEVINNSGNNLDQYIKDINSKTIYEEATNNAPNPQDIPF